MKTKLIAYFVLTLFTIIMCYPANMSGQQRQFIVVLDAGHGGKDPGNRGNGHYEKDIALNIVMAVGKELEKNKDIKVIYTRKTDVFLELHERSAIANKANADLFVSIHCNAHNSNAHGTETFVLGLHKSKANFEIAKKENQVIFLEEGYKETYAGFDPNSPESLIGLTLMQEEYLDQSIEVASYIQENFTNQLKRNNRSVKQAGFLVLMSTYMPSVLIETGFLTNKEEGDYLNSKKGQADMAAAISNAIINYYKSIAYTLIPSVANSAESGPKKETLEKALEIESPEIYEGIKFKVQIAASSRKLEAKPSNFKGLDQISMEKEDNLYKYFYGETSDFSKIKLMQKFARQTGYTTAFIVAYKNGEKSLLSEILKSPTN